jgi:hypothetical protein
VQPLTRFVRRGGRLGTMDPERDEMLTSSSSYGEHDVANSASLLQLYSLLPHRFIACPVVHLLLLLCLLNECARLGRH